MFSIAFALLFLAQGAALDPLPPLDPDAALRSIRTAPGFRVELAAAEPLVLDPVAFDWDASGRLWVVEMADYPMGMDGKGQPGGRVRILEDSDGDGSYDKSQLLAEGLSFPTGILTWRDGAIVTAAPDILFLKDTDGDGKADQREVLFTGFLEGNQQLRINGLRWGLDNWVHCAAGGHYRGYASATKVKSVRTGQEIALGSRDFRFRPDTGEFEPESGPAQFGRNRDEWGHWFGTQNSHPLWHYVLEDRYLKRNPHVAAPDPTRQIFLPTNPEVFPISSPEKRFHSFEHKGHFTSACAGMIYGDSLLFGQSSGLHAFVCEPFHNVVQHKILIPDGVSFTSRRAPGEEKLDIFASSDRWCRPVMTRTGPDGALWIADMYRLMIEHPDWLPEQGRAELLPIYRKGEDRGRIYRLLPEKAAPRQWPRLDRLSAAELVQVFESDNAWLRDQAQQMLLWRNDRSATKTLEKLASDDRKPFARLHALCTLDGLRALTPKILEAALPSKHAGLRENALRLAEQFQSDAIVEAAARLVEDPSASVRLQLASSLGEWKSAAASQALVRLAVQDFSDEHIASAIVSSALPHLPALSQMPNAMAQARFLEPILLTALGENQTSIVHQMVAPMLRPAKDGFSAGQMRDYATFLKIARAKKIETPAFGDAAELFSNAEKKLQDRELDERLAAASVLARDSQRQDLAISNLVLWLGPETPSPARRQSVALLAETGSPKIPALVLRDWPSHSPAQRAQVLELLLRREAWTLDLLRAIQSETISAASADSVTRAQLRQHSSKQVRDLAAKLFDAGSARAEIIAKFRPALTLPGDPARGQEIYRQACQVCHKRGTEGVEVGPNLDSVASHPPDKLLVNIIDPNADVQPGFYAFTCVLKNGEEVYGVIAAETANSIVIKLPNGFSQTIARSDIATLRSANLSLMPEGLEASFSPIQMADLIAFLKRSN